MQNSQGGASERLCWGLKPRAKEPCEPGHAGQCFWAPVFSLQSEGNPSALGAAHHVLEEGLPLSTLRCSCQASASAKPRSCPPGAATLSEQGGLQRPGCFLLTWVNPVGLQVVQGSLLSWERLLPTLCTITSSLLLSWMLISKGDLRTGHGTTDWFQIGKGVHQGVYCYPAYLTYMQSTS